MTNFAPIAAATLGLVSTLFPCRFPVRVEGKECDCQYCCFIFALGPAGSTPMGKDFSSTRRNDATTSHWMLSTRKRCNTEGRCFSPSATRHNDHSQCLRRNQKSGTFTRSRHRRVGHTFSTLTTAGTWVTWCGCCLDFSAADQRTLPVIPNNRVLGA